ncbi:hypothetical protein CER22_28265 [Bacillus sp. K2I17]|nr:hypothetical protein CER22_28265 [Bacillus sp. K2I17]
MPEAKFVVVESKKENQQQVELPKEENKQEVESNGITKGEIKFVEKNGVVVPMKNKEDDVALSVNTTLKDIADKKGDKEKLNTSVEQVKPEEVKQNEEKKEENKPEEVKPEEKKEENKPEEKKEDKKGKDKDKASKQKDKNSEVKEEQGGLSPIAVAGGVAGAGAVGVGAAAGVSPTFRRSLQSGLRRLRDLFRK